MEKSAPLFILQLNKHIQQLAETTENNGVQLEMRFVRGVRKKKWTNYSIEMMENGGKLKTKNCTIQLATEHIPREMMIYSSECRT